MSDEADTDPDALIRLNDLYATMRANGVITSPVAATCSDEQLREVNEAFGRGREKPRVSLRIVPRADDPQPEDKP
mgnify:CR=1 FL=1